MQLTNGRWRFLPTCLRSNAPINEGNESKTPHVSVLNIDLLVYYKKKLDGTIFGFRLDSKLTDELHPFDNSKKPTCATS